MTYKAQARSLEGSAEFLEGRAGWGAVPVPGRTEPRERAGGHGCAEDTERGWMERRCPGGRRPLCHPEAERR